MCTAYDRIFGDFPAKNTVHTFCVVCVVLANPAYTYKALTVHFFLCCICRARFCPYLLRLLSQGAPLNVPFHNNFFHLPLTAHAWCTTRSDEVCTKVCVKARTHREAGTEARAQSISDQARAQSFSDQARTQFCTHFQGPPVNAPLYGSWQGSLCVCACVRLPVLDKGRLRVCVCVR